MHTHLARSVGHELIATIEQVLADAKAHGLVGRNAVELVNTVAPAHKDPGVLGVAERSPGRRIVASLS
jgi:hypothetical protein